MFDDPVNRCYYVVINRIYEFLYHTSVSQNNSLTVDISTEAIDYTIMDDIKTIVMHSVKLLIADILFEEYYD